MIKRITLATLSIFMIYGAAFAEFDPCSFNFGTDWDYLNENRSSSVASAVDYVTMWIVQTSFNGDWHGAMLDFCKTNNKTPVFYAYIIAKASGLGDADVGGGLNTKGAEYLQNNFNSLKGIYGDFASQVASRYGTDKPIIWLIEPDWYQYFSGNQSVSLSFSEASNYFNELASAIKSQLPNAQLALDISPWNNDQASYINNYDLSQISFMFNSGGRTEGGNERIRLDEWNNVTWKSVSDASGVGIIADDGYGVGGGCTGHGTDWDNVNNLKARIADGVVAITQKCPDANWGSTIQTLKAELAGETVISCGQIGNKYSLTIDQPNGGTIAADPQNDEYSQGSTVTLTATPDDKATFIRWTGDASGTSPTTTITMDGDKSVSAEFETIPDNHFSISLTKDGGTGEVSKSPDEPYYAAGTEITLTATPVTGVSIFKGWGGDVADTDPVYKVTIQQDMQIVGTFEDTLTIDSMRVEAEDFTQKSENIVVESNEAGGTNIGYIEQGNTVDYNIDISNGGTYEIKFNVATGLASGSFDVLVNGSNEGSVSFSGTTDQWHNYQVVPLSKKVALSEGQHTVQLQFDGALNVDWFVLVKDATISTIPGCMKARNMSAKDILVSQLPNGFSAALPANHSFSSYSLIDLRGRTVHSGAVEQGSGTLNFAGISKGTWILKLQGTRKTQLIRASVVR